MYRALYRKWRPQLFLDMVGQEAITTALKNQILAGKVAHAYMFTGTRGTGKTSCAKVFAKAVNCEAPKDAEPCGLCPMCKGLEDGSILDVAEIDAASNNGVDHVRDLRDEAVFRPSRGKYRIYIVDEVHMLTPQAFNALLKTLEEPPSHVIFILATTELHKVPATILSRCQKFDFVRIDAEKIAQRLLFVAKNEKIDLAADAADLISRLANGSMRDALSLLDTCSGANASVDETLVRKMAGVADKSYLFSISDAAANADIHLLLELVAQMHSQALDVKRLCEELVFHYRNMLLALAKPGASLLDGVIKDERVRYDENCQKIGEFAAVAAVRRLALALDKMSRLPDPRIELELALIDIAQAGKPGALPQNEELRQKSPVQQKPQSPQTHKQPQKPENVESLQASAELLKENLQAKTQEKQTAQNFKNDNAPKTAPGELQPFQHWNDVLKRMQEIDKMLSSHMKNTRAYLEANRVLIAGGDMFLTYVRENSYAREKIKTVIEQISGKRYSIGPYEAEQGPESEELTAEATLRQWQEKGVEVIIE